MIKQDELSRTESCFNKARDDERLFVLLERDPAAPIAIRAWAAERIRLGRNVPHDPQIVEALEIARSMSLAHLARTPSDLPRELWYGTSQFAGLLAAPLPLEVTWAHLVSLLELPIRRACTLATCSGSRCPLKAGPCWSPAVYHGARRTEADVARVSFLVLDVDQASDAEVRGRREALRGYQHLIHATHSDSPDRRCLRVVVQLSRAVGVVEWRGLWHAATRLLGASQADSSCSDPQRIYYLPSRPLDADYFMVACAGTPLDVDGVLGAQGNATSPQRALHS